MCARQKNYDAAFLIWREVCGMNRSQNRDKLFAVVSYEVDLTWEEVFRVAYRMAERGWITFKLGRHEVWWIKPTPLGTSKWRNGEANRRRRLRLTR